MPKSDRDNPAYRIWLGGWRAVRFVFLIAAAAASEHQPARAIDALQGPVVQQSGRDRPFRHAEHESIPCTRCHNSSSQHARVTVLAPQDCLRCHHSANQRVPCGDCHDAALASTRTNEVTQTFQVAAQPAARRQLPFLHGEHPGISCRTCHTQPLTLSARATNCESCHTEHHTAQRECTACHIQAPESAHPRVAHVTCAGSGCHGDEPFVGQARTRNLCLSCHQKLVDHKAGKNCIDCHVLPPWHVVPDQRRSGARGWDVWNHVGTTLIERRWPIYSHSVDD